MNRLMFDRVTVQSFRWKLQPVTQVCAGLSDLLGPASQIVVVGQRDSEEEYATEEEEDGGVWQGAQFHQSDGGHCNRQVYKV